MFGVWLFDDCCWVVLVFSIGCVLFDIVLKGFLLDWVLYFVGKGFGFDLDMYV